VRLWIAQGFGIGRIPFAPGTFGSLVGLIWSGLLLATGHLWSFLFGTILGLVLSVWLCGFAEKVLRKKDPGSVVLDEIAAMPVCFGSWIALRLWKTGAMPGPDSLFSRNNWLLPLGAFVAFRIFDIWKPWPVHQSQNLAGGWGVTVDDLLAAIYVSLIVLVISLWKV
jgi:phosphatidylglycerophosphatase A